MSSDANANVSSTNPIVDIQINTDPVTRRMQDMYRRVATKPDLELVEVTALVGSTLTCRKIGTTTTIPGVIPVGWESMMPPVGAFVWIMTTQPGAQPFAIGMPAPKTPAAKSFLNVAGLAVNNAVTIINWDNSGNYVEEYDTANIHNPASNSSRFTVPGGIYDISGAVTFQANSLGIRGVFIYANGTIVKSMWENGPGGVFDCTVEIQLHLLCGIGTYIELGYFQNVGGVIGMTNGQGNTYLSVVKMADL
jgi:hypothetical protein